MIREKLISATFAVTLIGFLCPDTSAQPKPNAAELDPESPDWGVAKVATPNAKPEELQSFPFPASPLIVADGLDEETRNRIKTLVMLPNKDKERPKLVPLICPQRITKPSVAEEQVKTALAVTETDMSVEVKFGKGSGAGRQTEADEFSVYIEFDKKEILLRPSLPRFNSDAVGMYLPIPSNFTRFLWVEGKQGSDLLYLVPELEECGVQSIVICPRTYVPRSTLALTNYQPVSARYFVNAKADGLFAVGPEQTGKIQASMLATEGVLMPKKWSAEDTSSTPSATVKFQTKKGPEDEPPPFIKGQLPILGAVEARLDFGDGDQSHRSVRTRTTIEIAPFPLAEARKTLVRGAMLNVEVGACYMVSRWKEQWF